MSSMAFFDRLSRVQTHRRSLVCVGLDPEPSLLPSPFRTGTGRQVVRFCTAIVEATNDLVCAYKPNWAFFEALGLEGLRALEQILDAIPKETPVIADAKRGDIGNTAKKYARAIFETWGADAVTVNPYMGVDTLEPFLEYADRGVYALCLTSNPGAVDFEIPGRLYLRVARRLSEADTRGNLGLVVGATQSRRIAAVRRAAPELPFLLPGIGAQGGDARAAVRGAWTTRGGGVLVNASRSILYASPGRDFAQAARAAAENLRAELHACIPGA